MSRTVPFGDSDSSSWTAVVDYGDRAGTETISMSTKSFTLSHAYADEGTYRLTVSVTDDRGASGNASASVTVVDAAPVLSPIPPANLAGTGTKTYTQAGSFTDPSSDSWSATVDYGDGTGVQPLTLSATTFTLTHSYTQGHTFTLTVTVTDDDGSSSGTQTTVKV